MTEEQVTYDQFVNMMLQEIGEQWKEHCLTASIEEEPIGIVIPHIEKDVRRRKTNVFCSCSKYA